MTPSETERAAARLPDAGVRAFQLTLYGMGRDQHPRLRLDLALVLQQEVPNRVTLSARSVASSR